jgi:hypothetical protein
LDHLEDGESCNQTWVVNATGQGNSKWEFFTIYENGYGYNTTPRLNITIIDVTPPTIIIISPPNATIADSTPLLNVTFGEMVSYTWYNVNGTTNSSLYPNTFNLTLNLTNLEDGQHNVTVYANDSVGNLNFWTVWFTVDTTPPTVINVTITPSSPAVGSLVNISANITDEHLDTVLINITYPNGTIITKDISNANVGNLYYYYDFNASIYGTYYVRIIANDTAGNVNSSVNGTFPAIRIISRAANLTANTSVKVINATNTSYVDIEITVLKDVNATVNVTLSSSSNALNVSEMSSTYGLGSGEYAVGKYISINVSDNIQGNLSWTMLKMYYNVSDLDRNNDGDASDAGVDIDSSKLKLYWYNSTGNTWVKLTTGLNLTQSDGPYVYGTDVNQTAVSGYLGYLWANLSHFSVYGIAGSIVTTTTTTTTGGGGGGTAPSVIKEGFNTLTSSLLGKILKELNIGYKQFYETVKILASILVLTGDRTGEYPAPELNVLDYLAKPIKPLTGDVYEISAEKVLKRWTFARAVVIARGDLEVDSLAAIAYAKSKGVPILLTKSDELPQVTIDAIKKLNPKDIIIAGGPVAVSNGVEEELAKIAKVERIWGQNREETAVELAKKMEERTIIKTIVIADGRDASTEAAIIANGYKAPVIYVSGEEIPQVTKEFLIDHKRTSDVYHRPMKVVFVGISNEVQKEIESLMKV